MEVAGGLRKWQKACKIGNFFLAPTEKVKTGIWYVGCFPAGTSPLRSR